MWIGNYNRYKYRIHRQENTLYSFDIIVSKKIIYDSNPQNEYYSDTYIAAQAAEDLIKTYKTRKVIKPLYRNKYNKLVKELEKLCLQKTEIEPSTIKALLDDLKDTSTEI